MLAIVRIALRRPYTFIVVALGELLLEQLVGYRVLGRLCRRSGRGAVRHTGRAARRCAATSLRRISECPIVSRTALVPFSAALIGGKMEYSKPFVPFVVNLYFTPPSSSFCDWPLRTTP